MSNPIKDLADGINNFFDSDLGRPIKAYLLVAGTVKLVWDGVNLLLPSGSVPKLKTYTLNVFSKESGAHMHSLRVEAATEDDVLAVGKKAFFEDKVRLTVEEGYTS